MGVAGEGVLTGAEEMGTSTATAGVGATATMGGACESGARNMVAGAEEVLSALGGFSIRLAGDAMDFMRLSIPSTSSSLVAADSSSSSFESKWPRPLWCSPSTSFARCLRYSVAALVLYFFSD